jgi:predicted transcriptional regulator of viral defense system
MWQEALRQLNLLSRQHKGVFTTGDVRDAGISTRTFYRMRDAGKVICISRGVYQMAEIEGLGQVSPDYAAIKARIPQAVVCTISALYHHELTVEIPRCIHLAIERNMPVPKIDYPAVRIYRMSHTPFFAGVEQMEIDGVRMKIFSPEKTIADSFKYRDKFGIDLAIEALKKYIVKPSAKPTKILQMAKICRVEKLIKPYLEAII